MELAAHGAQSAGLVGRVRLQNLDWHDQGVLQEVVEDHAVEDIDATVVRAGGEEGVLLTEVYLANSLIMVLQVLIWSRPHVHVEPNYLLVIGTEDEVVPLGVDRD